MILEHDALCDEANHEPGAVDEIHTKEQLSTGLLSDLEFQHACATLMRHLAAGGAGCPEAVVVVHVEALSIDLDL
jgi:hypothetical protein